jgi:uncharacterized protein YicC (UPF0701 family)
MSVPSQGRSIDEMSKWLGKIEGVVEGLERYVHEFRHDERNRRQVDQTFQDKVIARLDKMRDDIEEMRAKDAAALAAVRLADREEFEGLRSDVEELKRANDKREGVWGAIDWLINSPLIGWLAAAAAIFWGMLKTKH